MLPAKLAVAAGVALLLVGYALGLHQPSASLDGHRVGCDSAVHLDRIPFAEAAPDESAPRATPRVRRAQAACHPSEQRFAIGTWAVLGLGALLALGGWDALREGTPDITSPPRSTASA